MKVKQILISALLLCHSTLWGQDYTFGARAQAMGGAGVAYATDPEGQLANPALASTTEMVGATIFYTRPFGLKDVKFTSISARLQVRGISIGAAVLNLGHEVLQDRSYRLTIADQLFLRSSGEDSSQKLGLACGLQGELRELNITGYGTASAAILNAGLIVHVSPSLQWGVTASNLLAAGIGNAGERLAQSMSLGLSYRPRPQLSLQAEFFKQRDFPEEWRGGIEFEVITPLILRLGFSSEPDRATFGMALRLRPAMIHFTTFSHLELGWTRQFAVTLQR